MVAKTQFGRWCLKARHDRSINIRSNMEIQNLGSRLSFLFFYYTALDILKGNKPTLRFHALSAQMKCRTRNVKETVLSSNISWSELRKTHKSLRPYQDLAQLNEVKGLLLVLLR